MNLTAKENIVSVYKKNFLKPKKGMGQNFLVNKEVLEKIIKTANLSKNDIILEIGPGTGILTFELAKRVKKVIAVEKDPNLVNILNKELEIRKIKNVKVVQGDILKIQNSKLKIQNSYKIVANLPYYITSPTIRKFLELSDVEPPKVMILMVQKEVGQRIVARPKKMNLLAISVQFYAKPEIVSYVSKKSFWPQPKVDSAIIKITPHRFRFSNSSKFREQFFKIVRAGFSRPRKQILNNLSKGLKLNKELVSSWLRKNKILTTQRAETLSIKNWIKLTKTFPKF